MKYFFYIDESGDHSLQNINEDFPYFLLCGILISETENAKMIQQLTALKHKIFGTDKVILHSRDIRKCDKHFQILFNLSIKEEFYRELNSIIQNLNFTIISNAVKKIDYIKQYGKSAANPYHISLSYMLERMTFCLNEHHASGVSIFVEKRGKNEDQDLLNHYNTILDKGTYYVSSERFKAMIDDFEFRAKNLNDCGIQLADLCAYPLINVVKNGDIHNPSYKIIEPKIYRNPKTKQQCGLKVIP